MIRIGKIVKRFGEKVENYENKLIEKLLRNKIIEETHATGKIGADLKKETVNKLPSIYKQMIEKKKMASIPIIPDEAEIWIREIYSDKTNEKKLRRYINEILEKTNEEEKIRARIYLTKFYRKVVSSAALIKDEIMAINDSLRKLDERTLEEIKKIKEGKNEKIFKKIMEYTKKIIRYGIQILIPQVV